MGENDPLTVLFNKFSLLSYVFRYFFPYFGLTGAKGLTLITGHSCRG